MRRLVICADGTWNGPSSNTNVFRLKSRLSRQDQECFYSLGVGAFEGRGRRLEWLAEKWIQYTGGAFGAGLGANVKAAYRWVAENYQEGDSLWFFGYSRGAFTVRSTVGFIRTVGLIPQPIDDGVLDEAYDLYRAPGDTPDNPAVLAFRERHNTKRIEDLDIAFLGVWDTVGALGVPGRMLGRVSRKRWGFHDYHLSGHVKRAYQALAADELRAPYLAALWRGPVDDTQEVGQRWFAGNHGDIGGERADLPLKWVARKAEEAGLVFDPPVDEWPETGQPRRRPAELQGRMWRAFGGQGLRPIGDDRFAAQDIDDSVNVLRDSDKRYRPENLEGWLRGEPLTAAVGRKWWYTLPGTNEHYLRQWDIARR